MLLFLHFLPGEQSLLEKAAEKLEVAHRCSFNTDPQGLFELAENRLTTSINEKFPAVIFLNADSEEHLASLKTLKTHDILNRIPVVCLGYPKTHKEVVGLYEAGANSYIEKPTDFETMMKVSATALSYWLDTTLLPSAHLEDL